MLAVLKEFTPRALARNVSRTAASEFEQGVIRIAILGLILTYVVIRGFTVASFEHYQPVLITLITYLLVSMALMLSFARWPMKSDVRRSATLLMDLGATTITGLFTYQDLAISFIVYMWLSVGYGARYGRPYLIAASALGTLGFCVILKQYQGFWDDHRSVALGFASTLVIIPMFVASLIAKSERAKRDAERARAEAESANRAKSQFLANMSHEIRTPLGGVIGMTSLLEGTRLDREQREFVDTIQASAKTLLSVIEDILDISKIEAGKTLIELIECDIRDVLTSTTRMLEPQARSKNLDLRIAVEPQCPRWVRADALHLRQILINLIGNAIKFTEHGHIDVRLGVVRGAADIWRLRFEVADTGIGIDAHAQAQIFDSFTQADQSTTRRFGGTGLGTTISKHLVELMGGSIGVHSEVGVGSCFWFEIEVQAVPTLQAAHTGELSHTHVIVVDESGQDRAGLSTLLHDWVASVEIARAPAQALARLIVLHSAGRRCAAIVVQDNQRTSGAAIHPTTDPTQFAGSVKRQPELASTALLLIANRTSAASLTRHLKAGYRAVLGMPVDKSLLFNALLGDIDEPLADEPVVSRLVDHLPAATASRNGAAAAECHHILLVEDNPINRRVISMMLERGGHRVTVAEDGDEGLERLLEERFDLAIVDMQMPNLGGLEVMQQFRFGAGLGNRMPFIVLSGNATLDAKRECEAAGADEFITKPIEATALLDSVSVVMARAQDPDDVSATPHGNVVGGEPLRAGLDDDHPAAPRADDRSALAGGTPSTTPSTMPGSMPGSTTNTASGASSAELIASLEWMLDALQTALEQDRPNAIVARLAEITRYAATLGAPRLTSMTRRLLQAPGMDTDEIRARLPSLRSELESCRDACLRQDERRDSLNGRRQPRG
ncbi:MAG: response regulator [Gammaproteobacteria bacterium]|nr:response regulator [Gammaproteobacteria bacterium]